LAQPVEDTALSGTQGAVFADDGIVLARFMRRIRHGPAGGVVASRRTDGETFS
jgi:hypothetical protein